MWSWLLLFFVTSNATLTEIIDRDDNNKIHMFRLFKVGVCYYTSVTNSFRVMESGIKYIKTYYKGGDCSDYLKDDSIGSSVLTIEKSYIYGEFSDLYDCSIATNENNNINYIYTTDGCISYGNTSHRFVIKDEDIYINLYDSNDCSEFNKAYKYATCGSCSMYTHYVCWKSGDGSNSGSKLSIIYVVLITLLLMI
ncbi:hypothetical protein QTN25_005084 [Entamoeba marina]